MCFVTHLYDFRWKRKSKVRDYADIMVSSGIRQNVGDTAFPSIVQRYHIALDKTKGGCQDGLTGQYLGSINTDDPIAVPGDIVEVGNSDSLLARGHPVLLGAGVNLEDVRSGGEDGLFSETGQMCVNQRNLT